MNANNFGQAVEFLRKYVDTIVLGAEGGPQIAVVPDYQGRTMTSSVNGGRGPSNGWINYRVVATERTDQQINLYGGEDRFWLAPEGGQFGLFFPPESSFDFVNWRTPALIDTQPFLCLEQKTDLLRFQARARLVNRAASSFEVQVDRTIRLLDQPEVCRHLRLSALPHGLEYVAHCSDNQLTNIGEHPWTAAGGLLAIWILTLCHPTDDATIVLPYRRGSVSQLGEVVLADYFGLPEADRLRILDDPPVVLFRGDGRLRSKIGLSSQRAQPVMASWTPSQERLTLVHFDLPDEAPAGYTNSRWQYQENPYAGDVVNSYNDGPNESGQCLGPFYELETLSPALALAPQSSYTHTHRTMHFTGSRDALSDLATAVLGLDLSAIEKGL
jgi:hypothetical protein